MNPPSAARPDSHFSEQYENGAAFVTTGLMTEELTEILGRNKR